MGPFLWEGVEGRPSSWFAQGPGGFLGCGAFRGKTKEVPGHPGRLVTSVVLSLGYTLLGIVIKIPMKK